MNPTSAATDLRLLTLQNKKARLEQNLTRASAKLTTSQSQEDIQGRALARVEDELDELIENGADQKEITSREILLQQMTTNCEVATARSTGLLEEVSRIDRQILEAAAAIAIHQQQEVTVAPADQHLPAENDVEVPVDAAAPSAVCVENEEHGASAAEAAAAYAKAAQKLKDKKAEILAEKKAALLAEKAGQPADGSNQEGDSEPTAEASPAPEKNDESMAAADDLSNSSEDYESVHGDVSVSSGHPGSLPAGNVPCPTLPIRDMPAAGTNDVHTPEQPFTAEVSVIRSAPHLHTGLYSADDAAIHCDEVHAFITVILPRPIPEDETDYGEDAGVRAVLFRHGSFGLELPTLPANIKGINTGSSSVLHSVQVDGSSFHDVGVEPASMHTAGEDPEALLAIVGYNDTHNAQESDGKGILVISAGMDYTLLNSITDHVRLGVPSCLPYFPSTGLPASHWSIGGSTYVAVPLDEIVRGNSMTYHGNFSQLLQYCSISAAGYHPMGSGRMLNMMPSHAGMKWSTLGETFHEVPVKSPSSTASIPFADAIDVSMVNDWVRQTCQELGFSGAIEFKSYGENSLEVGGFNIASVPQHREYMIMTLSAVSMLAHLLQEFDARSPPLAGDPVDEPTRLKSALLQITDDWALSAKQYVDHVTLDHANDIINTTVRLSELESDAVAEELARVHTVLERRAAELDAYGQHFLTAQVTLDKKTGMNGIYLDFLCARLNTVHLRYTLALKMHGNMHSAIFLLGNWITSSGHSAFPADLTAGTNDTGAARTRSVLGVVNSLGVIDRALCNACHASYQTLLHSPVLGHQTLGDDGEALQMQGATDALQARKVGLASSLDLQVYAMRRDLLQHDGPAGGAGDADGDTQPFDLQYFSGVNQSCRSHVLPTAFTLVEITVQCILQQSMFFDQIVPITIGVDAALLHSACKPLADYFVSEKSTHADRFTDNIANTHKLLRPADLRRLHDHLTVAVDVNGAACSDLTTVDVSAQSAPFQLLNRLRMQWAIRSDLQHMVIQSHCLDAHNIECNYDAPLASGVVDRPALAQQCVRPSRVPGSVQTAIYKVDEGDGPGFPAAFHLFRAVCNPYHIAYRVSEDWNSFTTINNLIPSSTYCNESLPSGGGCWGSCDLSKESKLVRLPKHAHYHDEDKAGLCCPPYELSIRSDRLLVAFERERSGGRGSLQEHDSSATQQHRRAYALLHKWHSAAGHHGMLGVPLTTTKAQRKVPVGTPKVFGHSPPTAYSNVWMLGNASCGGSNLAWLLVVNGVGSTPSDISALQLAYPDGYWTEHDIEPTPPGDAQALAFCLRLHSADADGVPLRTGYNGYTGSLLDTGAALGTLNQKMLSCYFYALRVLSSIVVRPRWLSPTHHGSTREEFAPFNTPGRPVLNIVNDIGLVQSYTLDGAVAAFTPAFRAPARELLRSAHVDRVVAAVAARSARRTPPHTGVAITELASALLIILQGARAENEGVFEASFGDMNDEADVRAPLQVPLNGSGGEFDDSNRRQSQARFGERSASYELGIQKLSDSDASIGELLLAMEGLRPWCFCPWAKPRSTRTAPRPSWRRPTGTARPPRCSSRRGPKWT